MQQVSSINVNKLPADGYLRPSREEKKEAAYKKDSHIPAQGPLTGIKTSANKLYNDILVYFPKGFKGSKNSDFHEYLSLGLVPYLVGTATMIATYGAANGAFNSWDRQHANAVRNKAAAAAILYGLAKVASKKLSRTLINASTGVNLDLKAINKNYEIPEPGQEKGVVRNEIMDAFSSVEFPRIDLLEQDGELSHGDKNYHYDRIAKKMGYKERLNAPGQIINKKIREVKTKATAMENILGYVPAAFGVALGWQEAFGDLKLSKVINIKNRKTSPLVNFRAIPQNVKSLANAFGESFTTLWHGSTRNKLTKNFGKVMILGAVAATVANWLVPTLTFKQKPDTMKSKVDTNKEYEVC